MTSYVCVTAEACSCSDRVLRSRTTVPPSSSRTSSAPAARRRGLNVVSAAVMRCCQFIARPELDRLASVDQRRVHQRRELPEHAVLVEREMLREDQHDRLLGWVEVEIGG